MWAFLTYCVQLAGRLLCTNLFYLFFVDSFAWWTSNFGWPMRRVRRLNRLICNSKARDWPVSRCGYRVVGMPDQLSAFRESCCQTGITFLFACVRLPLVVLVGARFWPIASFAARLRTHVWVRPSVLKETRANQLLSALATRYKVYQTHITNRRGQKGRPRHTL